MKFEATRRGFLGTAAGSILGMSATGVSPAAVDENIAPFRLGIATYTYGSFDRAATIKYILEAQVKQISIKEFHAKYVSTPEELAQAKKDFADAGIQLVSGGNISLTKDLADMRKMFDYAKALGLPMIVCAPSHENIDNLEKLIKEYNIKAAIHNHGPEDKHFPTPESVLQACKGRDPRMGLCMDIGHSARTGTDVVKAIADAGPRLLDVHVKDLKDLKDKNSQCDVGEGAFSFPKIFKQLQKMGFKGNVNLEYEINRKAPQVGVLKSLSYMRGVLAGMKG